MAYINLQPLLKAMELMMGDGNFCINLENHSGILWHIHTCSGSVIWFLMLNKVYASGFWCWTKYMPSHIVSTRWLVSVIGKGLAIQTWDVSSLFAPNACLISERTVGGPMTAYAVKGGVHWRNIGAHVVGLLNLSEVTRSFCHFQWCLKGQIFFGS